MSTCSLTFTAGLVLLLSHAPATTAAETAPAGDPKAQLEEIQQFRDRVAILEGKLASQAGLGERIATLEGKLMNYDDHIKKVVDVSIESSNQLKILITSLAALFALGTGAFWVQLAKLRARAKKAVDDLHVARQVARAVGDLIRGDQVEKPVVKKLWWTHAYQKLSSAQEMGDNDPDWLNWRAYTLRRLGDVEEALAMAHKAAEKAELQSPQRARALYNIACYSALLGRKPEVLHALREAVRAEPLYKALAAGDTDFDCMVADEPLRNQFAEIVDPEQIQERSQIAGTKIAGPNFEL